MSCKKQGDMMETITLGSGLCCDALMIPGAVVDRMLGEANESQLKIYIYLLKNGSSGNVTISSIADYFNYTEQDVRRALRFWKCDVEDDFTEGSKARNVNDNVKADTSGGNVVTFSVRPSYSKEKLSQFALVPEVAQLLFVAEQYMGRPIKSDDIASMLYMYDEMKFAPELIEYLLEYCISNNKKNFRSIEAVAVEWKESGVTTVSDAKRLTRTIPKEMAEVLAAFGIDKSHQPIDAEIAYVRKWTEAFGYRMDIIGQACQRTIMTTGKPSFKYANSILKGWHDGNVRTVADIVAADEAFAQKRASEQQQGAKKTTARTSKKDTTSGSKFRNFKEREYDYDLLMKDLLSN